MSRFFANLGEFAARFTKKRPLLPKENVEFIAHGFRVDGSKAARDLGIKYTPLEEGMRKAIIWYWEQGLLKRKPVCVNGD